MNRTPDMIRIPRSAPWLPPSLLTGPEEIRFRYRPCEAVRKGLHHGQRRRASAWCEQHRIVTLSSRPGRWKNATTPYLAGIMDASFHPAVRRIVICAAPQTGKSESVYNCIAVAIDQDPGPVLMVYPDEKTSDDNCADRIQPMIRKSPRLRSYMTGIEDDFGKKGIKLVHMPIYFGWARSASSLANKPCKYAINDEVDKYPETTGRKETTPILLTQARLTTYIGQEKHWLLSTPTVENGPIWKEYLGAQVRFDYWVVCPFCRTRQQMVFAQIKWRHQQTPAADGRCHSEDPERIEAEGLAWYECPHCGAAWNEYDRDLAVRAGGWRERVGVDPEAETAPPPGLGLEECLKRKRPAKIAFHIPSWLSTFVPFGKVAASFLRGIGDIQEFKDFCNKHKAEPWRPAVVSKSQAEVLAARCDLPPQTVPERAIALTAGVDVQQHGFWFAVRAWAPDLTSWLVHYGFLATWEDVERLLFETAYPAAVDGGRPMRIFRACVDTGGSRKFEDMTMTEETYFWLIKNRGRGGVALWGTKGSSTPLPGMLSLGKGIVSTPAGKKLPGVIRLLSVDTAKAKDQYHFRLKLASREGTRDLPGAAFLHDGVGLDYVAQILAEEKQADDKGREIWVNVHGRPNHLLDADCLAGACVEMEFPGGGLRLIADRLAAVSAIKPERNRNRMLSRGVE